MRSSLFRLLAIVTAVACVALVATIEILNLQSRDAIGLKQQQEPHSKWRLSSLGLQKRVAERALRQEQEIPDTQPITPEQAAEIERLAQEAWARDLPYERLARTMRNYSAWGAPLGLLTFVLGSALGSGKVFLRATCCSIGALTLLIALVRYIPSLGW